MPIHWPNLRVFLPNDPDVLGGLRAQMAITIAGMDAFEAWAGGDPEAAERVRDAEHEADGAKRELRVRLSDAFITPIGAEDIFILSQLLDKVLNDAKDVVREAEVMDMAPDDAITEMAGHLREGVGHLSRAFDALATDGPAGARGAATAAADDATKSARRTEKVYRSAMASLLELETEAPPVHTHIREVMGRRELYRRLSRIADTIVDVADRVWYAAVKEM